MGTSQNPDIDVLLSHRGFVRTVAARLLDDPADIDDVEEGTTTAGITHPASRRGIHELECPIRGLRDHQMVGPVVEHPVVPSGGLRGAVCRRGLRGDAAGQNGQQLALPS